MKSFLRWPLITGLVILLMFGLRWLGSPAPDGPAIEWQPFSFQAFKNTDRPVIIDVYADWCVPCIELEHSTFRHPQVLALSRQILPLRIDATKQSELPEPIEAFLDQYEVRGLPTILFFDAQGVERRDLRLEGFETGGDFARRIGALLE